MSTPIERNVEWLSHELDRSESERAALLERAERAETEIERRHDVLTFFAKHWLEIGSDDERLTTAHDLFVGLLNPPDLEAPDGR